MAHGNMKADLLTQMKTGLQFLLDSPNPLAIGSAQRARSAVLVLNTPSPAPSSPTPQIRLLSPSSVRLCTPCCIFHTKAGSVPHLTSDYLRKLSDDSGVGFLLSSHDFLDINDTSNQGPPINSHFPAYLPIPDNAATFMTLRDQLYISSNPTYLIP